MQLLVDEQLSPRIAQWCAGRRVPPLYAAPVAHYGLGGQPDGVVWRCAFEHNFVVVTTNARDFLALLDVELHPGLIVLRKSGLTREEQWERVSEALDYIQGQPSRHDSWSTGW